MRKLLSLLLLLSATFFSKAQTATDDNFEFSYVTYSQGNIVLSCHSKVQDTACYIEVRMRWKQGGKDSSLFFFGGEIRQVMLPSPGGNVKVEAKTVTKCNVQSNGPWITVTLISLPIREDARLKRPLTFIPAGKVRVVAVDGSFVKEMSEEEFQRNKSKYRRTYFVLRNDKVKEIPL